MDHSPKKSKALLITIIAIVILLIAAYFIFKNGDALFGTKNSSNITKNFSPLLGTSKDPDNQATVTTGGTGSSTSGNSQGTGSTTDGTAGTGSLGGDTGINGTGGLGGNTGINGGSFGGDGSLGGGTGLSVIPPPFNPLPTPDILSTELSPSETGGSNTSTTDTVMPPATVLQPASICPADDPLVFTDDENVQLADLLRQYYLIANSIRTDDDVAVAENDYLQNKALTDQVAELTAECRSEKANLAYTGPQTIKNNPYYAEAFNTTTTYVVPPTTSSPWIASSEYYQSGYGQPKINLFGNPPVIWPNAYYSTNKVRNYADFENKFNIW